MWWGGLRGSVGLALALAVYHTLYDSSFWGLGSSDSWGGELRTPTLDCRDQPLMVLLLTVFIVSMTVLINGVTMAPLMSVLNLTEVPEERIYMIEKATHMLEQETFHFIDKLKDNASSQDLYPDINWDTVKHYATKWFVKMRKNEHVNQASSHTLANEERDAWLLSLNLQRAFYKSQFEAGLLASGPFNLLEHFMAEVTGAAAESRGKNLGQLYDASFSNVLMKQLKKTPPEVAYETCVAYRLAADEVRHVFEADGEEDEAEAKVHHELEDNLHEMNQFMANLRRDHIALIRHCQAMVVKCKVLYKQHEVIEHMLHEGELLDLDANRLRARVDAQLKQLYLEPLLRSRCGALLVAVVEGKLVRRVLPEVSSVLPRKLKKRNSVKVWDQFMDDVQNVRRGPAATVTAGFGGAASIARQSVGEAIRISKPGSVRPGTKDDSTMDLTAEAELSEVVRRRSADEMALAQMATASALELEKDTSSDVTMDTVVEMVTPAETSRSAHEAGATDEAAATKPPMEVEDMS